MKKTNYAKSKLLAKKDQTQKIALGMSAVMLGMIILGMIAVFCDTHTYGWHFKLDGTPDLDGAVFQTISASLLGYFHFALMIATAIICIINVVHLALFKTKKIEKVGNWLHICNLVSASALAFNFFFSFLYLIPLSASTGTYCWQYVFTGSNLIFNVLVPALGIFMYIFCFKGYSLKNKWYSLIGVSLVFVYFLIYMILGLTNVSEGVIDPNYDLYMFGAKHYYLVIIALLVSVIVTGAISIGLWQLNKISKLNRWMIIFVISIFLAAAVLFATGFMFHTNITDDRFREHFEVWESVLTRFLLWTHFSNWIVCATSIIYAVYSFKMYKGQIKQIPIWAQILRLAGVAGITVTLLMQCGIAAGSMINPADWHTGLTQGYLGAFRKHLILEHFIVPVLSIVSYVVIERGELRWKHLLYAGLPLGIYAVIYAIFLYAHVGQKLRVELYPEYKEIKTWWDMYNLSKPLRSLGGPAIYWLFPILFYLVALVLDWCYWMLNRKIHFDLPKKGPAWAELKKDWLNWKASRK